MLPFDPKKPLCGFTTRFPHAKRRFQFFINEPEEHVYFRPQHAPEDWWGVIGDAFFEFRAQDLKKGDTSPFDFTRKAKRFMRRGEFFRQFFLPDPREGEKRIWSIHWRHDVGRIYPVQQPGSVAHAYFRPRASEPCNLFRASTEYIRNQFLLEWNDPTSDAREALRFCDLSHDERTRQVLCWESGSLQELEHMIKVACSSETDLWQKCDGGLVVIDPTEDCPLYVHPALLRIHQAQVLFSPRLHRVLQRICDCNVAFAQRGKNDRNLWGHPWEPELPSDMLEASDIHIQVESPTQHERMEASLILREWLREHAPDLLSDWF